ncbi:MAG: HAD-IIB family hydrolase [Deltaproteobacteria bacterium]|nr:HAD-IIB family hydrolase [Deltaproteobacteria bacterium]
MIIIFTDLDGTLLDAETYSYHPAADALQEVDTLRIPLVVISSKTGSEIESIRRDLRNDHPFVAENGGGLFVPEGYFPFPIPYTRRTEKFLITDIGISYARLSVLLDRIAREHSLPIRGFHSLPVEEVSRLADLPIEAAARAKEREYDEPFLFDGNREQWARLEEVTAEEGLTLTRGGRFHHLSGPHDKGTAARILADWYRQRYPDAPIVGLGDAANDLPFLRIVDYPVLVQRSDGTYETGMDIPGLCRTTRPGPAGWGEAVLELIRSR